MWVCFTVLASLLQVIRNSTSKQLSSVLKPHTISFVRFAYSVPLVIIYLLALRISGFVLGEAHLPLLIGFTFIGATLQNIGYCLMVSLFKRKRFAVAINLTKTDTLFAYLLSLVFLSHPLAPTKVLGIFLAGGGSVIANGPSAKGRLQLDPSLTIGLLSGFLFAATSIAVVSANASFRGGDLLINAATTLLLSLSIQSLQLFLLVYLLDREDLRRSYQHLGRDILVGITSGLGSICWFTAFSLEHVALVKAVGEIEFVLSVIVGYLLFKEALTSRELIGVAMTVLGVFLII